MAWNRTYRPTTPVNVTCFWVVVGDIPIGAAVLPRQVPEAANAPKVMGLSQLLHG
jgi:hypothetical protein